MLTSCILGPSTTWLLRYLANRLDACLEGFDLDLAANRPGPRVGFHVDIASRSRPDMARNEAKISS